MGDPSASPAISRAFDRAALRMTGEDLRAVRAQDRGVHFDGHLLAAAMGVFAMDLEDAHRHPPPYI